MIACHCMQLTDRDIRAAVDAGAHDMEAVAEALGAATGCGGCAPLVEELVADANRRRGGLPILVGQAA